MREFALIVFGSFSTSCAWAMVDHEWVAAYFAGFIAACCLFCAIQSRVGGAPIDG